MMNKSIWIAAALALAVVGCGDSKQAQDAKAAADKAAAVAKDAADKAATAAKDAGSSAMQAGSSAADASKAAGAAAMDSAKASGADAMKIHRSGAGDDAGSDRRHDEEIRQGNAKHRKPTRGRLFVVPRALFYSGAPMRRATSRYPSITPPRSRRKRSLSIFSCVVLSQRRQPSGVNSSPSTSGPCRSSSGCPNSSL